MAKPVRGMPCARPGCRNPAPARVNRIGVATPGLCAECRKAGWRFGRGGQVVKRSNGRVVKDE